MTLVFSLRHVSCSLFCSVFCSRSWSFLCFLSPLLPVGFDLQTADLLKFISYISYQPFSTITFKVMTCLWAKFRVGSWRGWWCHCRVSLIRSQDIFHVSSNRTRRSGIFSAMLVAKKLSICDETSRYFPAALTATKPDIFIETSEFFLIVLAAKNRIFMTEVINTFQLSVVTKLDIWMRSQDIFQLSWLQKHQNFCRDTGTVSAVSGARQNDLYFNEKGGQFSVLSVVTKQEVFDQKSGLFSVHVSNNKTRYFWRDVASFSNPVSGYKK